MALICLASAKGSPGVTLTARVAAALPADDARRKLLLEADPSGGSLAIRYQLGRQPGLVTLAAAGRHGLARDDLWAHAQALPGGLPVVVAPERADRAESILEADAGRLGRWLAQLPDVTVIADCGRLTPTQAEHGLCSVADLVILVARPTAEQVQPAAVLAQGLAERGRQVGWVLIGDRPHDAAAVQASTGIPVARVLPDDPRGAEALSRGEIARRGGRSPLVRALSAWAAELAENLSHMSPSSAGDRTASEVVDPVERIA